MENNKAILKELNKFLKGIKMGTETFKKYEEKAQDGKLKHQLSHILSIFHSHDQKISAAVLELGGKVHDSLGIEGEMALMFEKLKEVFVDTDKEILEHAVKAIDMGIKNSERSLKALKELTPPTQVTEGMTEIVNDYKTTLKTLEQFKF